MHKRFKKLIGLVMAMALLTTLLSPVQASAANKPYVFTTIDFPGAAVTQVYGINARGDMVGTYIMPGDKVSTVLTPIGIAKQSHGFVFRGGKFTSIDYPDPPGGKTDYTIATGISPEGDIVGYYAFEGEALTAGHGFILTNEGEWSTVPNPAELAPAPTMTPSPFRILPDGTTVGCFHYATSAGGYISMHGYVMKPNGTFFRFEYPGSTITMHYGATPDGKMILGTYIAAGQNHGYILAEGEIVPFDVPGSIRNIPMDINAAGLVVGNYRRSGEASNVFHGYLLNTNRSTNPADWEFITQGLDFPGVARTVPRGINARGDFVGDYTGTDGKIHGFIASTKNL